jgi:PKD repeat protein
MSLPLRTPQLVFLAALALDAADNPHIAYQDWGNGDLKYASWTGSSWTIVTVDATGNVGAYAALALDAAGHPHIAYYDITNGDLRYAYSPDGGSSWQTATLAQEGDVGQYASIAIDSAGYPHITYYDDTAGTIRHTWQAPCQPIPSASFTWAPAGPYDGEMVTFSASVPATSTPEVTFSWTLGDGATASGPVVTHTYATAGTYPVVLTARNCQGYGNVVVQHNVAVTACTRVSVQAIDTAVEGCAVTFNPSLAGTPPIDSAWDFGALGSSNASNPTVDFGHSGDYTYSLSVSNCRGLGADSFSAELRLRCIGGPYAIFLPVVVRN